MKVLMINGSPHRGNTYNALAEMGEVFAANSIDYEIVDLGAAPVNDCTGCGKCRELKRCVIDNDIVNSLVEKARESQAFVFGTPVYYAHPTARVLAVLDRAFFSGKSAFAHKPGCAISSLRRGGATASMDVMNKYFTISEMPVVSANYWNMVHRPGETQEDLEGRQTLRNLARNMVWLLKCLEAGKEKGIELPNNEYHVF